MTAVNKSLANSQERPVAAWVMDPSLEGVRMPKERTPGPVSYTHLDVYKRQGRKRSDKLVLTLCVGMLTRSLNHLPLLRPRRQI